MGEVGDGDVGVTEHVDIVHETRQVGFVCQRFALTHTKLRRGITF